MVDFIKSLFAGAVATSGKMKFNREDAKNLTRNTLVVGAVAMITYLGAWASGHDIGVFGPVAAWAVTALVDFLNKLRTDNTKSE